MTSGTELFRARFLFIDFDSLPVVRRFLCPPEMPLSISFPTLVSAQDSSPSTCFVGGRKKTHKKNIIVNFSKISVWITIPSEHNL